MRRSCRRCRACRMGGGFGKDRLVGIVSGRAHAGRGAVAPPAVPPKPTVPSLGKAGQRRLSWPKDGAGGEGMSPDRSGLVTKPPEVQRRLGAAIKGWCEPTAHRFVWRAILPPPHRLLERQREPTLPVRELSVQPAPSGTCRLCGVALPWGNLVDHLAERARNSRRSWWRGCL